MFTPAQVLPFTTTTVDVNLYVGAAVLAGWSWVETTGLNNATVNLLDGPAGPLIVPVTLAPNESTRDPLPFPGIYVRTGLYVQVTLGSVAGSLWFAPAPESPELLELDLGTLFGELHDVIWEAGRRE